MGQLAKYAFGAGTKHGVLTNGAVWMLVRSFVEGTTLPERVFWKVDLESEELSSISRKLITVSRNNVEQIEVLVRKVQILDEIWQSMLDEPEEMIRALIPVIRGTLAQEYPGLQFEDTELESLLNERVRTIDSQLEPTDPDTGHSESTPGGGSTKGKMRIANEGSDLHNYFEILVNTANWLIRKGRLGPFDCPVPMGHRRHLISTQKRHRYNDDFRAPKPLSNGLWIETHYNSAQTIGSAKRLLKTFGYPPDTLVVELREM